MSYIVPVSLEEKDNLIDRIVLTDGGKHEARIVNVGNYCPDEDTIYLHLSSTTQFRDQRNGKNPVQYSGWYYVPHLEFV